MQRLLAVVAGLLLGGLQLRAATLYVYDLDSLAFMSNEIAEARVQRLYEEGGLNLAEVKVLKVHKGTFREGKTAVVAGLYFYHKLKKIPCNTTPLAVGDRLILFLTRARDALAFPVPKGADIYMPVPSGVRLIEDGRMVGFVQRDNPGPYVAYTGRDSGPLPTLERFQADLAASIRTAAALARDFEQRKGADAAPWLLKLLRSRSKQPGEFPPRDHIAELACMRLAELHKPALLEKALPLAQKWYARSILERGFGSPIGRDFLLARVNDVKAPLPERIRHAQMLENAGKVYRSTFCEIGPNSWRIVGKPDRGNSGYLTRIARAALAARQHEDLCHPLVECLAFFGRGRIHDPDAEIRADWKEAFAVLKALYDTGPSEKLKYAIELAAAHRDREVLYQSLKSPCGQFISIVWPADPKKYTPSDTPTLLFEYTCNATLFDSNTILRPSLVLLHLKSQESYVLPTELRVKGGDSQGGSGAVELPRALPHGRYRVFLRLTEKGKTVSTGHYFETELLRAADEQKAPEDKQEQGIKAEVRGTLHFEMGRGYFISVKSSDKFAERENRVWLSVTESKVLVRKLEGLTGKEVMAKGNLGQMPENARAGVPPLGIYLRLGFEIKGQETASVQHFWFHGAAPIPKTDSIYPVLAAHQAAIAKRYEDGKCARPLFSDWMRVNSPAAAKLFPKLQFASISWSLRRHPEAKGSVALAEGLKVTVAIDAATKRIIKELHCGGNYEAYGKLLVDRRALLRDAAEAKLVWEAFGDIHHIGSKKWPCKKVSASEWHLGISRSDQTKSVADGFKTVVTQTYYAKVLVDSKTGRITSWESKVDSSDERKIPTR